MRKKTFENGKVIHVATITKEESERAIDQRMHEIEQRSRRMLETIQKAKDEKHRPLSTHV